MQIVVLRCCFVCQLRCRLYPSIRPSVEPLSPPASSHTKTPPPSTHALNHRHPKRPIPSAPFVAAGRTSRLCLFPKISIDSTSNGRDVPFVGGFEARCASTRAVTSMNTCRTTKISTRQRAYRVERTSSILSFSAPGNDLVVYSAFSKGGQLTAEEKTAK